jgi:hypothetical protein
MPDVPASPTRPAPFPHHDVSLADITERLMTEFNDRVPVSTISRIVLECRHDLQGSPVLALPELVERLARQRLLQTRCDR